MKRIFIVMVLALLLAGCIEYREEMWLNRDGSGRIKMVVGVLTNYENKGEINRYLSQPGINLISKSVYRKGKFTYYKLDFTFKSLNAFNQLNDEITTADFLGRISLNKEKDGTITFNRKIALGGLTDDEDVIEQLILNHPQENLKWQYVMHLPWKVVKANADPDNIDYKNRTVSWEYQTLYLWNKPQTMTVRMKPSLPLLPFILAAVVILLIAVTLAWWKKHMYKATKKTSAPLPEQPDKE